MCVHVSRPTSAVSQPLLLLFLLVGGADWSQRCNWMPLVLADVWWHVFIKCPQTFSVEEETHYKRQIAHFDVPL